ncbi:MAG: xylulokinase, partial [Planctomycetes bacterium]|nr:xylulokinase [Planctomycetota bacterium]
MSAIGSGAVRPGVLVMSLGTSGTLFAQAEQPVVDPAGEIAPFCDATGHWMPLLCTLNCTTVTEEVRAGTGLDHEALTAAAGEVAPGCEGVSFLPYLAGERTPNWPHATGALLGLREGSLRPGLLFRAAMEGATFALAAGVDRLKELGVAADELMLVGGGSKNALWRQVVADVTGLRVRLPAEAESAALGGALQSLALAADAPLVDALRGQAVPLEDEAIEPSPEAQRAYQDALALHLDRARQLFG